MHRDPELMELLRGRSAPMPGTLGGSRPPPPPPPPTPRMRLPHKLEFLFSPKRYKVAKGGRGGGKSWGFAKTLLLLASIQPLRILCARELQVSIKDSVHKLLSDIISNEPAFRAIYSVTKTGITNVLGSEFLFTGIKNNVTKVKSMEGIDICWVEEAETVSNHSWDVLIPTIRKPGSEIWISFNPDQETDPTYVRFVKHVESGQRNDVALITINWEDNPWFPDELRLEKDYLYRVDPEAAAWVWGGKCRTNGAAQILRNKYEVRHFIAEPTWDGPYYGADWGFSLDPTTLVKMFIHIEEDGMTLYIRNEAYAVGCELDDTPELFDSVPGARQSTIRADSARPETIRYMQRHGYGGVRAAVKWPGSVEDGIAFLRQFKKIVIHPDCKHAIEEARLYSYKVDRLTKLPTVDIVDAHNHIWDAVRYALEPMCKQSTTGMLLYMKQMAEDAKKAKED